MTTATCTLPARCDRAAAATILPAIRSGIDSGAIAVDGGEVAQLGQAMLQLLLSARRTAMARGAAFSLTASDALRTALAQADAEALLDQRGGQ